jgi:hypothetical protein
MVSTKKKKLTKKLADYIKQNIVSFHQARRQSLEQLKLENLIRRKNPYLYRAKDIQTAEALVRSILDAHLSSQEESMFGGFLEGLAIFVCSQVHGGHKSSATGIDLEFEKNGKHYIVSIKSGPNWGNSQQIARMISNFKNAKKILQQNSQIAYVEAVNGCCYGRSEKQHKGDYIKLCGQAFWEFISDEDTLYVDIIEPLGKGAYQPNLQVQKLYNQLVNKMTAELLQKFCKSNGQLDWEKILAYNSGK